MECLVDDGIVIIMTNMAHIQFVNQNDDVRKQIALCEYVLEFYTLSTAVFMLI